MSKINELFEAFNRVNKVCEGKIVELSVKQHQVTFTLDDNVFRPRDFDRVDLKNSFVSFYNDKIFLTIENLGPEIENLNPLHIFMTTIHEFAEHICTCPSLEFVISSQYLKCFLDKPGLSINDLTKYEEILEAKGEGELELHPQRAYLLFINMGENV